MEVCPGFPGVCTSTKRTDEHVRPLGRVLTAPPCPPQNVVVQDGSRKPNCGPELEHGPDCFEAGCEQANL